MVLLWDIAPVLAGISIIICLGYSFYKKRFMTFSIMIACVLVFIFQMLSTPVLGFFEPWYSTTAFRLGFMTSYIFEQPWMLYTLVTSMFVHSGIYHLVFNIVALIMIGMILEDRIGTYRYAIIFFTSGIFATFFFSIFSPNPYALLIGASGAFCGVLGAFTRLYPKQKVRMFMFFLLLPALPMYIIALLFLGLETAFAAMGGFNLVGQITGTEGQVAHTAHIGGFIFGLVVAPWVMRLEFDEPGKTRKKVKVDEKALERLAVTKRQKEILEKIKGEDEPDVKLAWIQELAEKSRCPDCGRKLDVTRSSARCKCGFKVKY